MYDRMMSDYYSSTFNKQVDLKIFSLKLAKQKLFGERFTLILDENNKCFYFYLYFCVMFDLGYKYEYRI